MPSETLRPRPSRLAELSPEMRALVRLCQSINFGSIRNLVFVGGEPVFTTGATILKDFKLDTDDGVRPEVYLEDFELPKEITRLISQLEQIKEGIIACMEIRAGIPRKISIAMQA